jgi:hypothetical protein
MFSISSFFERFRSRELEEITFRAAVIDSVKEVLSFDLEPSAISYSNKKISLRSTPAAKSAIFLKKNRILEKIKSRTNRTVLDIR